MITPRAKSNEGDHHGPQTRWTRLTGIASRVGDDGDDKDDSKEPQDRDEAFEYYVKKLRAEKREGEHSKTMGLEYWLELVDRKHRYGTNLLKYHAVWKEADTTENFFYWLDEGDGVQQNLEACPRDKLDSQQLQYLTREERFPYRIDIDADDGLLRWAKNGEKVTTHGPDSADDTEPNANPANKGTDGQTETTNHITDDLHNARGILQSAGHAVPAPLAKLIEMNQNKASWIYVSLTHHKYYNYVLLMPKRSSTLNSASTLASSSQAVSSTRRSCMAPEYFLQALYPSKMGSCSPCRRIVGTIDPRRRISG